MAEDREIVGEDRPKVYFETSFMFYLTGRETTDQKIASEQAYTRKWWEEERSEVPCLHVLVRHSGIQRTRPRICWTAKRKDRRDRGLADGR